MKLLKASERQHRQLKSSRTGEEYSLSSVLSDAFSTESIFLSQEIIRPGARSSGAHFHTETEEIVYVLEGKLSAVEGDSRVEMVAGDAILFERGSEKPHFLWNTGEFDAHALVIRQRTKGSDIVFGAPGTHRASEF